MYEKNHCWKKSRLISFKSCSSTSVTGWDMHSMSQHSASWMDSLCFQVVRIIITAHFCIMLGNLWNEYTHTRVHFLMSALWESWGVMVCPARYWEKGRAVTQWRFSGSKANILVNMSTLLPVQVWIVLGGHKAVKSNEFPFQGLHGATLLCLYLFWYVLFPS